MCLYLVIYHFSALDTVQIHWLMKQTRGGMWGLALFCLFSGEVGAGGTYFLLPPLQRTGGRWDLLPPASSPEEWGQVGLTSSCLPSSCLPSRGVEAGRTYILTCLLSGSLYGLLFHFKCRFGRVLLFIVLEC